MLHGHLDYFQKPALEGRLNTKPWGRGTPNAHNRWFILLYHVWGPVRIDIHWNNIWLKAQSHMTSHSSWRSVITLHDFGVCWDGLWQFLLGSHNFMVTALGSCVKRPLNPLRRGPHKASPGLNRVWYRGETTNGHRTGGAQNRARKACVRSCRAAVPAGNGAVAAHCTGFST